MFLDTGIKTECFGCEACQQICPKQAIIMQEDKEGFRYPVVDEAVCIHCNLCRKTCPHVVTPEKHRNNKYVFGGYIKNPTTRFESTSGGAFSAVVEAFCDENYVVFGAEAKGLSVFHSYITDKQALQKYRKSKYSQSIIGGSYKKVKKFLAEGKKVLFSGTPCQIAGLYAYLATVNSDNNNLLTVEVVCEGVPSPLYTRKMNKAIEAKYGSIIESLDYRYTGRSLFGHGKWDFEAMRFELSQGVHRKVGSPGNEKRVLKIDRWFNPFWSIWLNHLMSRPSCYKCPFAEQGRTADLTLGDLWGVHLYCPELYGNNVGSSLAVGNSEKGTKVLKAAEQYMYGHELAFKDALIYQSPMRKHIDENPRREAFMSDLESDMSFAEINHRWAKRPTLKLLWQKYIWGNRQKIALWNLKQKYMNGDRRNA